MKPRTFVLVVGLALSGVALGTPLYAQSGHVSISGWFSIGPQHPPFPPVSPYPHGPGASPYPWQQGDDRYRGPRTGFGYGQYALNSGYRDGYEKGLDDGRDRERFDPHHQGWYRKGDRGYKHDSYMSRDQYKNLYRSGFAEGYEAGYRDGQREGGHRRGYFYQPSWDSRH